MGRFLIDVPAGSTLSGGNYKYNFIRIEPVKVMTMEEFEAEADGFESKLGSAVNKQTKRSMLLQSGQSGEFTRIVASWKVDVSTAQISISGFRWIHGSRFLLEDDVGGSKQEFGVNRMRDALSRLRPRADTDIPTEPGFCFAGGPLASHKHDRPLLERMGGMTQFLGNLATSVRVLRKGERQVGPYPGQEHLATAPGSNGMRGHAFVWETQGGGTLDTPAIKIELTTGYHDGNGNQQTTSLTDKEAMKLWDDILDSFRLRPFNQPSSSDGRTHSPSGAP
jgi:hypothetical protein